MSIIKPKYIAIDSSLLGKWAHDANSSNDGCRKMAEATIEHLLSENWIIVITHHHFEELVKHADEKIVEQRMKFLFSFPQMSWIWRADGTNYIGSVVDINAAEISEYISCEQDVMNKDFRTKVRNLFLKYGKPSNVQMLTEWRDLRPVLRAVMEQRLQVIASICHSTPDVNEDKLLSAIDGKSPATSDEIKTIHEREAREIASALKIRGDKRLKNHEGVAAEFSNQIIELFKRVSSGKSTASINFMEQFGLTPEEFSENVTLGEFKEQVTRRHQLINSSKQLRLDFEQNVWPKLKKLKLPSEIVIEEIRKSRKNAHRASGSDLYDDYIASLVPYLDAVVVDKRTYEYLRQATQRKPELDPIVVSAVKASSYAELPKLLKSIRIAD